MKFIVLAILAASSLVAQAKPLKVFILSGQSNMVGMANIKTFPAIGMDPVTAPMLKELLDKDGKPVVCNEVYICKAGDGEGPKAPVERFGKLEAGYGGGNGSNIGPEYAFGIYMHKMLNEPILIIKVARGGRDLFRQFRPPSAGPLPLSEQTIEQMKAKGADVEAAKAKNLEEVGYQYRWMMAYVINVFLENFWPEEIDPIKEKIDQMSKRGEYEGKSAEIKKELEAAKEEMKTAKGNTRWLQRKIWALEKDLVNSFLTPEEAKMLEVGVSDAWFHYWGSAKFHCRTGKAFAEALVGDKK